MSAPLATRISENIGSLIGSEVLKIAAEITQLTAAGKKIANFTVGDFDPRYFPIPSELKRNILDAVDANQTNYPPSSGIVPLRQAVADFYTREFDVPTKPSEVLIAGGARPLIYTTFLALVNPGEKVLYPVPSWNNNHYCHLARSPGIQIQAVAATNFMPTAKQLEPHIQDARLICLNSPLNPTGTVFSHTALKEICDLVVQENERRKKVGARELFLMFDQIYWKILHRKAEHVNPVAICPEVRPYTIFIDGVSKYFCGTGLRVGWAIIPEDIITPFSNLLGHIGAWAPKPEQLAVAQLLTDKAAINSFLSELHEKLSRRLEPLYQGLTALKAKGYPIDAIEPQGGIYLSLQVRLGGDLDTNEKIRKALLEEAAIAVVPFQAFGLKEESGWFRMSVGAVDESDIPFALKKLEDFLARRRT